jgi:arginase family enzyme
VSATATTRVDPGYARPAAFLRTPLAADDGGANVTVVGVPYVDADELPLRSTADGPRELRLAAAAYGAELEAAPAARELVELGGAERRRSFPARPSLRDRGDLPGGRRALEALRAEAAAVAPGRLLVALGGDAPIAAPLHAGARAALGDAELAHVRIGRRLRLATDDAASPSARAAGDVLAAAAAEAPVVWLGVHGFQAPEERALAERRGHIVDARAIAGDPAAAAAATREQLADATAVHLSLDLEALDVAYAPGQRRLGVGGLRPAALLALVAELAALPLVAIDLVGLAPDHDPSGRTTRLALDALLELIADRLDTTDAEESR